MIDNLSLTHHPWLVNPVSLLGPSKRKLRATILAISIVPLGVVAQTKPEAIAGLKLWFQSDSGVFKDDAATSAAQPGDPVAVWKNQAGSANATAPETIAKRRPILTANVFNGKPALRFDGIDDLLKLPQEIFGTNDTGIAVFAVFKTKSPNGGLISAYHDASTYQYALVVKDGKGQFMCRDKDIINPPFQFPIETTKDVSTDETVILSAVYDGKVKKLYNNGMAQVLEGTKPYQGEGNLQYQVLLHSIGMQGYELSEKDAQGVERLNIYPQWAQHFNGHIAEILVYSAGLHEKNREAVERYLRAKYLPKQESP
jgi:hypothetical protein